MAGHRKQQHQQSRPLISLFVFLLCSSACSALSSRENGIPSEEGRWRRDEAPQPVLERTPIINLQPAHVVRDCIATITPAPLLRRQDQGQINALSAEIQRISESFRSVSQASQQVSQSSQQLSQSVQQANQRLSETERQLASVRISLDAATQASRSLSQAAAEASRRVDEARRSADQAIAEVSRSVSNAMMQNMAAATRSLAQALSQASQSAQSVVQKAQAEATAVRSEAAGQIQQAQGAALSVTQTALAVVGGIIGSSLITVAAFVLILRYRRSKRRRSGLESRSANISYPDLKGSSDNAVGGGRIGGYAASDAESTYSTDTNGYRRDIKEPPTVAVRGSVNVGRNTPGVGYALSYYGPTQQQQQQQQQEKATGMSGTTAGDGSGVFQLSDPPKGKFTLFPRSSSREDLNGPGSGISTTITSSSGGGSPQRMSKGVIPSLDQWIRAGTVSPFATLKKNGTGTGK
ncbi:hypothetical protein OQA88_11366 [Cercophora sp. LCS_1]